MGDSVLDRRNKRRNKEINRRLAMAASQRLYLIDTKTEDKLLLAEAYEDGWWYDNYDDFLHTWLINRDLAAVHGTEPTILVLKTESVND
jgi:hypothetical protein